MRYLSRRNILSAAGTSLSLPFLSSLNLQASVIRDKPQKKMIFLSIGFGVTQESWFADQNDTGDNYKLPDGLKPLAKHKKGFSVIQNTEHQYSSQGHWGSTFFLTGANQFAVPGKSFNNSISVDQVAAKAWGKDNRYASMQLVSEKGNQGGHGPGLSLSWNQYGKPLPGLTNPLLVYKKLFGSPSVSVEELQGQLNRKSSCLDAILIDAKRLQKKLNSEDRSKLDEYFQSTREIEIQLSKESDWMHRPKPSAPFKEPGEGIYGEEEIKLMYDLMVAALQTNSTRVLSYQLPAESLLKGMGYEIGPHNVSHYHGFEDRVEISKARDLKHSEMLSYLFDKLKTTKDVNGENLFENTSVAFGSNIRSGHGLTNCPIIVAGNTKSLNQGLHIVEEEGTPLNNVWLTLLRAGGIHVNSFGDSTGMIEDLLV